MTAPALGLTARATVDRVIDGDTIDVSLVLPIRVRLLDCWAPEMRGEDKLAGEDAKIFVESLLANRDQVVISIPSGQATAMGDVLTFGRVLAHIYVGDDSLAELVVGAGLATREKVKK
jgi:endonuclease YncB( thermonuclease family)